MKVLKSILTFPFKALYFIIRWAGYILVFPFGIYSLLRRHGKKSRQRRLDDQREANKELIKGLRKK